ncbi:MAG: glycosyltransferase family 2 protein [Bacteroidetes bacterium]|jgi:dolichol-phosphate mannosyltransferase|nr:glycosyltransferase family 2 protein [Bacteroidota bacterium]MBT3802743.1 glycosyltransferase family 2 protein [Bacteroidota bacterium]MBT4729908.1 glycosyltransferase family 2 protein [Bacteroidota bacterium]MBT4968924.1 glycosyltransferase family 2 protein [Bacteroidota bacterium]MBT5992011.1 glycosyltransferase family 2 protein [Bacteroidota bacterium]
MNNKPFITLVIPAYNEEAIINDNINQVVEYLQKLDKYKWEIVLINDGSKDKTGEIADKLEHEFEFLRVIHHPVNLNLGRAIQTGFKNAKGEIIVVLDIDLSYSVDHIEKLVVRQIEAQADIVLASCYMKGGKVSNVPFKRAVMSKFANKFMRFAAQDKYYTYTSMVRAYKSTFIKTLNLKTRDYEINPEILYKGMILRARIEEIPAHLNWIKQEEIGKKRSSSIKLLWGVVSSLMSGFIFRPHIYFVATGVFTMIISLYIIVWILINTFQVYPEIVIENHYFDDIFTSAVATVFKERPYSFLVGGFTFVVSMQLLSLGFIALQNKRYFEEMFHLSTSIFKNLKNEKKHP